MKKLFCILTCVCVLMALCVMTASAETTIPETKITVGSTTAYVDGEAVTLDIAPVLTGGEVFVSVYWTSQFVGATPSWDNTTKTASFKTENTTIELTIDSTTAKVNGESVTVPAAPFYSSSRAVVPVRFVAENLGATVIWDADTQTMTINPVKVTDKPTADFDDDGVVNVKDVLVSIQALLDGTALDDADMNGDGKITLIDVLRVLKAIVA